MADPDKTRVPFAIRKKTKMKLDELQREIRKKTGENISFPDLTHEIVIKTNLGELLNDKTFNFTISLDRRKKK